MRFQIRKFKRTNFETIKKMSSHSRRMNHAAARFGDMVHFDTEESRFGEFEIFASDHEAGDQDAVLPREKFEVPCCIDLKDKT